MGLKYLDLGHNYLSQISSEAFIGLNNLRELDLAHSALKVIWAGLLSSTPKLIKLNLASTCLESVEEGAFDNLEATLKVTLSQSMTRSGPYPSRRIINNEYLFRPFKEHKVVINCSGWTRGISFR